MSGKLLRIPDSTFNAKLFEVSWESEVFKVSGTLDGFIDLAVPKRGTYPLSVDEARNLSKALNGAISDVQANCLYEQDASLLAGSEGGGE